MFTSKHSILLKSARRTSRVKDNQCPPRWNVPIEMLSDDVLLEIFDLCLYKDEDTAPWRDPLIGYLYDEWHVLAHVCQRWRYVVFASPRRLDLRLQCSRRRVREMLGVWPAFRIIIWDIMGFKSNRVDITAALEHRDRVCEIRLECLTRLHSESLMHLMQEPFPALTKLRIESFLPFATGRELTPVLPDSFLGGSAPHLRFLHLSYVSFPALPNLLLTASHLVHLYLSRIPSGFISPEMVTAFSALTNLESMCFVFDYLDFDSYCEDPAPIPLTRSVLPALVELTLEGFDEYLDDFVARIDVPSINHLGIKLADRPSSVVDIFHLSQLIGCAENFRSLDSTSIEVGDDEINVNVSVTPAGHAVLQLHLLSSWEGPLPTLVQACSSPLLPLSDIQHLEISSLCPDSQPHRKLDTGNTQWIDIFRPFTAAESLSLRSMRVVLPVTFALKQVIDDGRVDVLPAIQKLSISGILPAGPVRGAIDQFVTARGLTALEKPSSFEWRFSAPDANDG